MLAIDLIALPTEEILSESAIGYGIAFRDGNTILHPLWPKVKDADD